MVDNNDLRRMVDLNGWIYERVNGDSGVVFAIAYEAAVSELKKVYPDVDEQLKLYNESMGADGMRIEDIGNFENHGTVWITFPSQTTKMRAERSLKLLLKNILKIMV